MQKTIFNYNNKTFRSISNSANGEVSDATIFHYRQKGSIIMANYYGGAIKKGTLSGQVDEHGTITMTYQHYNTNNEFRTGRCISTPELLPNGKIRLHESWKWTNGLKGTGKSIIQEI